MLKKYNSRKPTIKLNLKTTSWKEVVYVGENDSEQISQGHIKLLVFKKQFFWYSY